MKNHHILFAKLQLICIVFITFAMTNFSFAQNIQTDKELVQALEFVKQNRQIDALPLLEKVAPRYPNNATLQSHWGVAILVNSVTYKDETVRKKEIARAGEILKQAKKLGTDNVLALHYLDLIEQGGNIDSVSASSSKEVEDAIREGEGYFGRGDYEKAFLAYEKAYKLDPKNYDAALFAGDCFFAQKKFKESEVWFAKAVAINPNREHAYRFWGDALANQEKGREALEKYANAYLADPNSRLVFDTIIDAVRQFGRRKTSPFVLIPSKENEDEIVIDTTKLTPEDGSTAWNSFTDIRKKQIEKFNLVANGRIFSSTVIEDVECLKTVAQSAKGLLQKNRTLKISQSLNNLIKLDSLGMLDIYTILFFHGGDNSSEYATFREKNRDRMLKFAIEYFADDNQIDTKNIGKNYEHKT